MSALAVSPDLEPAPAAPAAPARRPGAGRGHLAFARVDGATALVRAEASSPLQLLSPRPRGPSACVYLLSHGGGLVAGDAVALDVAVGPEAAALLTTQAETKVYRGAAGATQRLQARVAAGGVLALLPEPVSPFAGSRFDQRQAFDLAPGASLLVVDAVVAGRSARGERWSLDRYRSASAVRVDGRAVLLDALLLQPRPGRPLAERLGRFDAFAVAFALGPAFAAGAAALRARLAARPAEPGAPVLAAASPLADGLFLRCAAEGAGGAAALAAFLREALAFAAAPLGADPFAHRW